MTTLDFWTKNKIIVLDNAEKRIAAERKINLFIFMIVSLAGIISSWLNSYKSPIVIGINRRSLMVSKTFLRAFFAKFQMPLSPVNTALKINIGVLATYILRVL